jgi:hypothetical protein
MERKPADSHSGKMQNSGAREIIGQAGEVRACPWSNHPEHLKSLTPFQSAAPRRTPRRRRARSDGPLLAKRRGVRGNAPLWLFWNEDPKHIDHRHLSVSGFKWRQGAREGAKVSKDLEGQAPRVPIRIIIAHSDRGEEQFPTRASHP